MSIRVYNTLSRKKEIFEPLKSGHVGMYVCGPTVYDSCHIGHARSVVVFDVIVRYLKAIGYQVTYVRNFTDVDDKIIDKANQLGVDCQHVAEKYIQEFYEDMDALNVARATFEPKVSEHMHQIVMYIQKLIEARFAYQINGDVYYSVEAFPGYGKLSGRKLDEMEAGARVEIDTRKHNPFDFVLWKSSKQGEPFWDSPWGKGRPGWHIECSAMSYEYLGETFDIHGGGKDLCFPHHENEIAQSESILGKPFVKYWIHNGFVNINQEKMSKSLGNFLMIKDVIKNYHPEVVRLFLLSNHYRSPIDYSDQNMDEARTGLEKIYTLFERIEKEVGSISKADFESGDCWKRFCDVMNDDFNTARGIGILFETVRDLNRLLDSHPDGLLTDLKQKLLSDTADLLEIGSVLGILVETPAEYFKKIRQQALAQQSIDPQDIDKLVHQRSEARKAKDWKKADQIRNQLLALNITLEDRPEGTVWKINS